MASPLGTAAFAAQRDSLPQAARKLTLFGGGPGVASGIAPMRFISVDALRPSDRFAPRHNSVSEADAAEMLKVCGYKTVDDLISATVPSAIRRGVMNIGRYDAGLTESEYLEKIRGMANKNKVFKSYLGMGYYNTHIPPVIQRNILENPGWYTQYTPYQAEIAQGRLEGLLAFQTVVCDLTGMEIANASLLDEATAAAEGMGMCSAMSRGKKPRFLISDKCHPQTITVCQTRASGLGIKVEVGDAATWKFGPDVSGALVQYPATDGTVSSYKALASQAHAAGAKLVVATDLLALTLLEPPGEWGADVVVGSAQRFGVPMGYGGPHAGFFACHTQNLRMMPGRLIGVSKDSHGRPALRMALQTREQHIRRDKATSNICTAQALLANIAAMYAVYHGPEGLKTIANRVHGLAATLAEGAKQCGHKVQKQPFFDTVCVDVKDAKKVAALAADHQINVRVLSPSEITIALDETTTLEDVDALLCVLNGGVSPPFTSASLAPKVQPTLGPHARTTPYLEQHVFNAHHSEHEMLRYLKKLENRDLSLVHSMIPLGSCTMKLNATSEMMPITWNELANLHPFVPANQAEGYKEMFEDLAQQLCAITAFDSVSLQPNAGASGEYAGLMAIRQYHRSRGDHARDVCLIPASAHGTNPASAAMAGMKIVTIRSDDQGNVDIAQLREKAIAHKDKLAALMITYPSTHGVYEEGVDEICKIIHDNGGQVYMDGANMNAQVGLTAPGVIGADVCHLNLHKTFCIPHGGGGPGMGPIGVKAHLAPFLPSHPVVNTGGLPVPDGKLDPFGTVSAAPFGSSLILPISYAYISMMGSKGLTEASKLAILNANYMACRLSSHYPILFKGKNGTCAHEFMIDVRPLKASAGIEESDIAKRLIDYGFHSPTMSWPVAGTLMIEPTESESKAELDRFCTAMIAIRGEIQEIIDGKADKENNLMKNAPHPAHVVLSDSWNYPYPRERAAYPADWVRNAKFWPSTSRVDNVHGDRHIIARIPTLEEARAEAYAAAA
ncbi:unnamed protein product [Ostreobium quekettii]|uniref:Glycine cleavage system P protein n=1 Tax=Ostreobium quekettii TaxID=121088 RepID=A0A8S1J4N7_9CHLO|nr:unnamed protein product [Ostreobium quekettii]